MEYSGHYVWELLSNDNVVSVQEILGRYLGHYAGETERCEFRSGKIAIGLCGISV